MAIAFNVLSTTDRVLLNQLGYDQAGGLYAYGDKFARILELGLVAPLGMMWPAIFFNVAKDPDAKSQFARFATIFAGLGGLVAFALTMLGAPLARLMDTSGDASGGLWARMLRTDGEFEGAASVIGVLTIGYVCYFVHDVARVGFSVRARNGPLAFSVCCAAVLNLALNWFWIPAHGALGAAWATAVAYGFMLAFTLVLSIPIYSQHWAWGRLATIGIVFIGGATAVGRWAPPDSTPEGLGVRALALAAAPLFLATVGLARAEDRAAIGRLVAWRPGRAGRPGTGP
jgi:Na+-driven multidrug efflux pump